MIGNRAFIISQPKAGTYLCANLLYNFGMVSTGMHVKNGKYRLYDIKNPLPKFNNKTEAKQYIQSVTHHLGEFNRIVARIPSNGFAQGHLLYDDKYINGLRGVKKILLTRPHSQHLESINRFEQEMYGGTSVKEGAYFNIEEWKRQPDVFHLHFQDLIKPRYAKLRKLQTFLFGDVICDEKKAIHDALDSPSPTKSSIR